ncbi:hypothetical protein WT83_30000 [Burkholderia territorii]|uniref:Uncharacterized protein n=1 Tax=Burkholderia territorii TaxID=1503055 RepID=A0A108E5L8_9BURK|nr:hypothetical protein WT83_30000 [Burkholderia territorii]
MGSVLFPCLEPCVCCTFRQFLKPAFLAVLLDVFETQTVYPCRTLVGLAAAIGVFQNVAPIHLIVQLIKPVLRFFLRFGM